MAVGHTFTVRAMEVVHTYSTQGVGVLLQGQVDNYTSTHVSQPAELCAFTIQRHQN